jgi:ATP-dependent DNA helicase RecQ
MSNAALDELTACLARFGLSSFRPGQREVIETALARQDCLCVMPTGGGKSLCYQLPAIVSPGTTLVVSPLIALMKDQVDSLTARGLPATLINSTISPEEQSQRLEGLAAGRYKLVYVVPERFRSGRFVEAARTADVRLLAIDEAHCVSEWGHDFRPDYARLGHFRTILGNPPTIALTATATDAVRRDIVELLRLRDPKVFITGFARPNLFYRVQSCATDRDKDETLFAFLAENPGSGIVYASTRKRCAELGERIAQATGRSTCVYHAGMAPQERRAAQEDFMQSRAQIAVATLAFGMGIDKADVRFVVHYNLPGSLEAYYQEAGRAGRDGLPAQCLLLWGLSDRRIHEFFIESSYPARSVVEQVYDYLRVREETPIEVTQQEVKEALGLQIGGEGVGACEKLLESAGVLERLETSENAAAVRINSDVPTLAELLPKTAKVKRRIVQVVERIVGPRRFEWCYLQPRTLLRELTDLDSTSLNRHMRELCDLDSLDYVPAFRGRAIHMRRRDQPFAELDVDFEKLEAQKAAEYERVEHVLRFARQTRCRQQQILHYFGETNAAVCGHCDNCLPSRPSGGQGALVTAGKEMREAVRIVLSGVARISRSRPYGCGKQLIAQMLCGSNSKSVTRNRLDKLSTFGLLAHLKQQQVAQLIDALLTAGLLEQTEIEAYRPIVQVTPAGEVVMKGDETTPLHLMLTNDLSIVLGAPARSVPAAAPSDAQVAMPPPDAELTTRLKRWREEVRTRENVPAFRVLSNAALDELARMRPTTVEGLLAVKGIGPAKVEQYGEALLEMLKPSARPTALARPEVEDFVESNEEEQSPPADLFEPGVPPAEVGLSRPSYYWTWRLLDAGFTPEECAQVRALSPEVVRDHALRAADHGHAIDAAWFLDGGLIEQIEAVLARVGLTRIRAALECLPRGTRYEDVQLVLKARQFATRTG